MTGRSRTREIGPRRGRGWMYRTVVRIRGGARREDDAGPPARQCVLGPMGVVATHIRVRDARGPAALMRFGAHAPRRRDAFRGARALGCIRARSHATTRMRSGREDAEMYGDTQSCRAVRSEREGAEMYGPHSHATTRMCSGREGVGMCWAAQSCGEADAFRARARRCVGRTVMRRRGWAPGRVADRPAVSAGPRPPWPRCGRSGSWGPVVTRRDTAPSCRPNR